MDKKIFIFTGKGGVGKSSISCSHAVISAKKNIKTILISIDPAHSLSDIFGIKIEGEYTKVMNNLTVVELDSSKILEEKFPSIKNFLANSFRKVDFSKINYTSSLDMPFIVNILSLIKILDIYENEDFANIIVDCPASASTFSYLKIPEMLSWYMERFFGVGKNIVRTLRPISKYKYKINLPDSSTMDEIQKVHYRLLTLQKILKNNNISTVRLVTLAEKMVIEESKRDFSYLNLYDYNVDGIFVNRILQEEDCDFIQKRVQIQEKYIEKINHVFYCVPIYYLPLMKKDMKNLEDLEQFSKFLEVKDKLLDIKKIENSQVFLKKDGNYILSIKIGNIDDIDVKKIGTDIDIRLNDVKRIISLPDILVDSVMQNTEQEGDELLIYLEKNKNKGKI